MVGTPLDSRGPQVGDLSSIVLQRADKASAHFATGLLGRVEPSREGGRFGGSCHEL